MNADAVEYIRKYQGMYTREAINRQLLAAGYPAVEIGLAWREVEGASPFTGDAIGSDASQNYDAARPASDKVLTKGRFWALLGSVTLLSWAFLGLTSYLGLTQPGVGGTILLVGLIVFAAVQLSALIAGLSILGRDRVTGMALLTGAIVSVVVVPCLGVLIFFGACLGVLRV